LLERQLIKLDDFALRSSGKEHFRFKSKVTINGYTMIDGIRYYIPDMRTKNRDTKEHIYGTKLNNKLGCIYNNQSNEILFTFPIKSINELEDDTLHIMPPDKHVDYYNLNKKQTDAKIFNEQEFNQKRNNETKSEFKDRMKTINDFKFELRFSKMLIDHNQFEFSILKPELRNIIFENQNTLNKIGMDKIGKFVDEFGKNGLEALIINIDLNQNSEKLLHVFEILKSENTKLEIIDMINNKIYPTYINLFENIIKKIQDDNTIDIEKYKKLIGAKLSNLLDFTLDESKIDPKISYQDIESKLKFQKLPYAIDDIRTSLFEKTALFIANEFGAEKSMDILNSLYRESSENPETQTNINTLIKYINPATPKELMHELTELYKKIKFEEYKLNEKMQNEDKKILEETLGNPDQAGKILELGCGTGRMLIPLHNEGYNVEGTDLAENHVKIIRGLHPEIKVDQADWKNLTDHEDNSIDNIYSIGRNILHEYQPNNQQKMFQEANRVLKTGGKFIFDIPDNEKGHYKDLVSIYSDTMHRRGINNFRNNTIYDSPDGEHFFTRYVYSHEDIVNLANDNGFKIFDIKESSLETGKEDINKYYVLEKISELEKQ
jgi:SAM-dependent methyltransferase